MCGIGGIVDFNGNVVSAHALAALGDLQAHRGPDGEGAVVFGQNGLRRRFTRLDQLPGSEAAHWMTAGLVHRRLAIIDLSERGAQPMADRSQMVWVTFNGEIYNYVEVRAELESRGHAFQSNSDTEVLVEAYLEWGEACLTRFNGMFAFAIWDERRQDLFCARDRVGIKPFCYSYRDGRFAFASESKALLPTMRERRVNTAAVADYLMFSFVPGTETMFSGIERLAPGCWLRASRSGLQIQRYWNPHFEQDGNRTPGQLTEELRSLLQDSARLQVRSDVPIGAHLSGGIDSSTVCCFAAPTVGRLRTFTAKFADGGVYDETAYARTVARHIGAEASEITPRTEEIRSLLPRLIYHLDEPIEGAATVGKYHVAQLVSGSVKVVLSGQGGDELFGGYDWYVKNLFTAACLGHGDAVGQRPVKQFMWDALRQESWRRLARSLSKNARSRNIPEIHCRNWSRIDPTELRSLLAPMIPGDRIDPVGRFLRAFGAIDGPDGDRMFKFDVQNYLEALLTSEDRLSMAFSVESRVPLLDHRIVEFAGRLGFVAKTVPGESKRVLRDAARGLVPSSILARRDKRGFPTPVAGWLRDGSLGLFEALVFDGNSFAREHFDLRRVRSMLDSRVHFGSAWSEMLWRILNVSVWGQVFQMN